MNFVLVAADSVTDFGIDEWDSLAADSTFMMSHGWLAASERIRGIRPRYLAVRSDRPLLGALPCYIDATGEHSRYQPSFILPGESRSAGGPWVIGGSPAGYESNVLVVRGMSAGDATKILRMLLAAAAELCVSVGAPGIALSHLPPADVALLRAVHQTWTAFEGPPNAVIDLPSGGFEGYLSTLSRGRQAAVKREIRAFERAGYGYHVGRLSEGWSAAAKLIAQLESKYGNEIETDIIQRSLRLQMKTLDDRSYLVSCRGRDGIAVGCCLLYKWGETLYARSAGFNYARLRGAFEYFNLVIYQSVRLAYSLGCRRLHLGMGSYDAKTARGATLRSGWWMLQAANGRPYLRPAGSAGSGRNGGRV